MPCCNESDELDDEIIETIIAKRPCLQDSDSDSDSETTDGTDPVTHAEVKVHIINLLMLLTQQGFNDKAHYLLDKCAHLVDNKCVTTLKQTFLHQFIQD